MVTLGGSGLKKAVTIPSGTDRNEWLAINTADFFNQINMIYGCVSEFCNDKSCPIMSAGKKYEYLLWPTSKNPKAQVCSAPEYVSTLMEWVESQLDNEVLFPHDGPFPKDFESNIIKTIFKRMFRIYAHIYYSHLGQIENLGEQEHLNTCFKHFMYFCEEFDIIDKAEQKPLENIIEQILKDFRK